VNDEEALIRAVVSDPQDEVLLSVFFDWLEDNGAVGGVARFTTRDSFGPDRSHLFVYSATQLTVVRTDLDDPVWQSLPLPTLLQGSETGVAPRWEARAAKRVQIINTWDKLMALARTAPSCGEERFSGRLFYEHSLCDRENRLSATWYSSLPAEYLAQAQLVSTYESLIVLADLRPEQEQFEAERPSPVPSERLGMDPKRRREVNMELEWKAREDERQQQIARRWEQQERRQQRQAKDRQRRT
jgi:hypothetical protein